MNPIEPSRLHELVRQPDQLQQRIGKEGVFFRPPPTPTWSDTASPGAVVLCCSDMAELPEQIVGSAFGTICALQSAGALLTPTMRASIRYTLATSEARVLVVLGHLRCGLLEHCWLDKPKPYVIEDLLKPALEEARQVPDGDLETLVRASMQHNAVRAQKLARDLRASLGRSLAVVVGLYDDLEHKVTLTLAQDAGTAEDVAP